MPNSECLTAPWLLFEAGAIAKSAEKTYVCTLLIDLKSEDVSDPLAQFQHTAATKDDFLKLVKDLNAALGANKCRPLISKKLSRCGGLYQKKLQSSARRSHEKPHKGDREFLTELVTLTRQTSMSLVESMA